MTFEDFIAFIEGCYLRGHKLSLERETLGHDNWPAARFVVYLAGIEYNKKESGIAIRYEPMQDERGEVQRVDVFIQHKPSCDGVAKTERISWVVSNG